MGKGGHHWSKDESRALLAAWGAVLLAAHPEAKTRPSLVGAREDRPRWSAFVAEHAGAVGSEYASSLTDVSARSRALCAACMSVVLSPGEGEGGGYTLGGAAISDAVVAMVKGAAPDQKKVWDRLQGIIKGKGQIKLAIQAEADDMWEKEGCEAAKEAHVAGKPQPEHAGLLEAWKTSRSEAGGHTKAEVAKRKHVASISKGRVDLIAERRGLATTLAFVKGKKVCDICDSPPRNWQAANRRPIGNR